MYVPYFPSLLGYCSGNVLRVLHVFLIFGTHVLSFIGNPKIVCFIWVGLAASTYLFHGCLLTRVEIWMTGEKYSVVDPALEILGLPVNRTNRMKITLVTVLFGFLVSFFRLPHFFHFNIVFFLRDLIFFLLIIVVILLVFFFLTFVIQLIMRYLGR